MKSIASFNGDLASLTAPPFILSPVSLVEYSQYWIADREIFLAPSEEQDVEQRFLKVVKWFLLTLRAQYCSRNEKMGSEKKPLNPFLGEVFTGKWPALKEGEGDTILVSEQVSHHPPVTAYSIWNDNSGVKLEGYNQIKASLSTTMISVKQYGHALYTLDAFDETYLITLPGLHIEGVLFGAPYVELEGKSFIQSSSGYRATIEYSGKGYFSGKKNSFKAKVAKNDVEKQTLYTIQGQWSEVGKIKKESAGNESEFFDATKVSDTLFVKPEEQQHELESRKAWTKVAAAIRAGDYDLIHREKSFIENQQREMRKVEKENDGDWQRRWFKQEIINNEPLYIKLCNLAGVVPGTAHSSSSQNTQGVDVSKDTNWRFVRETYDNGEVKA